MFEAWKKELTQEVVDLREFINTVMVLTGCSEYQAIEIATNNSEASRSMIVACCYERYTVEEIHAAFTNSIGSALWTVGYHWRDMWRGIFEIERIKQ